MNEGDPLKAGIADLTVMRNAAVVAHEALCRSPGFETASRRTAKLVSDYALALNAVSLMSTRWGGYGQARLSVRMLDFFLESAISALSLVREGMLNPARREMRFLLEASIKAWWCDCVEPGGAVETKVRFLDDLGAARFRDVVETIEPRLLDVSTKTALLQLVTDLYARLSTHVHASTSGIGVDIRRFEKGQYVGFETIADVNRANDLFAQVLDVSLAATFESFDAGLVGDIFVTLLDKEPKWSFHRLPLVQAISHHFDYKAERTRAEAGHQRDT